MSLFKGSDVAVACLLVLLALTPSCAHTIRVTPVPPVVSSTPIDQSLRVQVPFLALEGADHMPGITLLNWSAKNLRSAVIQYAKQRRTFSSVDDDQGQLTLTLRAWLWMRSRGEYRYIVHVESELGPTAQPPVKTYVVQKEAVGSSVRWVTASDEIPIGKALQAALDDLFLQIEEDAALYERK